MKIPLEKSEKFVYDKEKCNEEIQVDIPDDMFTTLAMMAHEKDITLNHLINNIIVDALQTKPFTFKITEKGTGPVLLNENHD